MNRLAIITGFLGRALNRYMVYQEDRTLAEKLEMASRVEGADGLELCYPADFEDPDGLKGMLDSGDLVLNFGNKVGHEQNLHLW